MPSCCDYVITLNGNSLRFGLLALFEWRRRRRRDGSPNAPHERWNRLACVCPSLSPSPELISGVFVWRLFSGKSNYHTRDYNNEREGHPISSKLKVAPSSCLLLLLLEPAARPVGGGEQGASAYRTRERAQLIIAPDEVNPVCSVVSISVRASLAVPLSEWFAWPFGPPRASACGTLFS